MVRIITDSAADFSPRELEQLNVTCIPLRVTCGEREYEENIDLNKDEFYALLHSGAMPKTSQASPQALEDLFTIAHEAGDEAIYLCLSSALSGTYQTAVMTQRMLGYEGTYVVDSRNATGGQRLLVEYAVRLRDEGHSAQHIVSAVEALRERIVLYACIDTLEYLYLGGRISHTAYQLGSLAQIKPIISVDAEGRVIVPAKAVGMRRGMDTLCKRAAAHPADPAFPFYAMYTDDISVAQTLAKRLESVIGPIPAQHIIQVGAAIGSHIGPAACGFVYVAAE